MKLKFQLKDDAVLTPSQMSSIVTDVMKGAASLLAEAGEPIRYTGSEAYWFCHDYLDRLNQQVEGEFVLAQTKSQHYELQYRSAEVIKTQGAVRLASDVERTKDYIRKQRLGQEDENIHDPEVVKAARDKTRRIFEGEFKHFQEAYGYTKTQINECAVAYLQGTPQNKWNAVDWRRYGQALLRMDEHWFGEPHRKPSKLESAIADRGKTRNEKDEVNNFQSALARVMKNVKK